jgi:carbamate kinase
MAETRNKTRGTVVVALGGNAILQPGQVGTFEEQLFNIDGAMRRIAELVENGWRVLLTHGNGPQVGNLLIQNALAAKTVAPMPMDVCGAMSQGQIGYMLEQTLQNHLRMRRQQAPVVTLLTQVAVSAHDKAFANPTKPVGPFYSEAVARKMMLEEGLAMKEDAGRGWRRVVPSPEPVEIVPIAAIRDMLGDGICVICSGGGGVPVVRGKGGALSGIDAVIDKDLAAALLAAEVEADALLILTDVPQAYVHYGTPEQRALGTVTLAEMRAYADAGHFKAGSMGPKVAACMRFVEGGGTSVIASLTEVVQAMAGDAGTRIVPEAGTGENSKTERAAVQVAKKSAGKSRHKKTGAKKASAKKSSAKKSSAMKAGAGEAAQAGATVIDINEARKRAAGGRA